MRHFATLIIGLTLLIGGVAMAADRGSAEEAKALTMKAASFFEANGDKSIDAFNADKASFVDRDLYVAIIDHQGILRASSGPSAALAGKNVWDLEDPDGKKIIQELWKAVETSKEGWTTYKYIDPLTKKIALKKAFVYRMGDLIITCGSYAG